MEKAELIIGIHSNGKNDAQANGLIKAFLQNGVRALSVEDCEK